MKTFGISALSLIFVFGLVGAFFTVIKPNIDEPKIKEHPGVVLGTESRLNFENGSL